MGEEKRLPLECKCVQSSCGGEAVSYSEIFEERGLPLGCENLRECCKARIVGDAEVVPGQWMPLGRRDLQGLGGTGQPGAFDLGKIGGLPLERVDDRIRCMEGTLGCAQVRP